VPGSESFGADCTNCISQASSANPGENLQKAGEIPHARRIRRSGMRIWQFRQAILLMVEMEFAHISKKRVNHAPLDFPCRAAPSRLPEHDGPAS
jgi:hypothetical protein